MPATPCPWSAKTGEVTDAQIFVAVLGASNYTYAEATFTQGLSDWTGSHVRAFTYFQGVTALVVPDNILTGITHVCRYEPELNPTYQENAHPFTAPTATREVD